MTVRRDQRFNLRHSFSPSTHTSKLILECIYLSPPRLTTSSTECVWLGRGGGGAAGSVPLAAISRLWNLMQTGPAKDYQATFPSLGILLQTLLQTQLLTEPQQIFTEGLLPRPFSIPDQSLEFRFHALATCVLQSHPRPSGFCALCGKPTFVQSSLRKTILQIQN